MKKLYEIEDNIDVGFCHAYVFDDNERNYLIVNEGTIESFSVNGKVLSGNMENVTKYLYDKLNCYGYVFDDMFAEYGGKIDVLQDGLECIHKLTHIVSCNECPLKDMCDQMTADSYCSGDCKQCRYSNYGKEKCVGEDDDN